MSASPGSGTFTQSGGTNTVSNTLTLAANAGSSGTYNLSGGSLAAATINLNAGGALHPDRRHPERRHL